MRERGMLKELDARLQEETKQKLGGIELPPEKLYMIDKVVRKKLQEHLQENINVDELDPAARDAYDPLESEPGPAEQPKPEETKGNETSNASPEPESKDFNQKLMQKIDAQIDSEANKTESRGQEHRLAYEEWLQVKEIGERFRQQLIESEIQELRHAEEQRLQERQEQDERK